MKARNVNLENTPLLTNNICKHIVLEAPTVSELEKKVKKYETLLVRALTNSYKLSTLELNRNGTYTLLPDGNYQSSMFLYFSGRKKDEISNPEKTLQYIKCLTEMEAKKPEVNIQVMTKQQIRDCHKCVTIPIEITPEDIEIDIISNKQRQLLEQLIADIKLSKISFFTANKSKDPNTNKTTISIRIEYDYIESLQKPGGHSNPEDLENR